MLRPPSAAAPGTAAFFPEPALVIERPAEGRPHTGKVLVAIQPHSDDIPLFAAGTVAKLLQEGYTGYLVRVTNDDMAGRAPSAILYSPTSRTPQRSPALLVSKRRII
jgi:hypothetical protein